MVFLRTSHPRSAQYERGREKQFPISITKNAVQFQFGETTLVSKLLEGAYPDYRKVVPDTKSLAFIPIGRADLLTALKRTAFIGDVCTLEFAGQMLTIRAKSTDKALAGEAVESLLIPKTKEINLNFNTRFLIQALEAVDDDEVLFHAAGFKSPGVMTLKNKPWISVIGCIADK